MKVSHMAKAMWGPEDFLSRLLSSVSKARSLTLHQSNHHRPDPRARVRWHPPLRSPHHPPLRHAARRHHHRPCTLRSRACCRPFCPRGSIAALCLALVLLLYALALLGRHPSPLLGDTPDHKSARPGPPLGHMLSVGHFHVSCHRLNAPESLRSRLGTLEGRKRGFFARRRKIVGICVTCSFLR